MTYTSGASNICRTPLYFHRVQEGETPEKIAARYNVKSITLDSNQFQTGEVLVVDLRNGTLSSQ